MTDQITSFSGKYTFLSNFAWIPFIWNGTQWPTAEHAFQATKMRNHSDAIRVLDAKTPGKAKRLARSLPIRLDWDEVKLDFMYDILRNGKFMRPHLQKLLLATDEVELIEGNTWGDIFWGATYVGGVQPGWVGANHLGKILMRIRGEING